MTFWLLVNMLLVGKAICELTVPVINFAYYLLSRDWGYKHTLAAPYIGNCILLHTVPVPSIGTIKSIK